MQIDTAAIESAAREKFESAGLDWSAASEQVKLRFRNDAKVQLLSAAADKKATEIELQQNWPW
jgi:hypothetical protein